ncbi:peptidase C12 ubiquitin carboxyl-terminal hydrolase 1 [Multifurca ochricompacta]|uniref:Ubiquitin carboxyl-terminal hydrolase n=1 Tax=Multifurca ochricompacta TaxID=376703 RepID=A0AAD4QL18_9AGAM|nr:peptidase C12 ubiquitin carboxyl-terminal hydrolase 1 [Multifurca ochricompacta]
MSRWIPLESNPKLFNDWAHKVGLLESDAEFVDIYGLDDELLDLVPKPVKAIILLFPIRGKLEELRQAEETDIKEKGQVPIDPTVFWIKQTISNACGTIGLLHALTNAQVAFGPQSSIAQLIDKCQDKTPLERAKFLESTELFADIHAAAAAGGQTSVPTDLDTDLHFTCFVQAPEASAREAEIATTRRRLIELDGGRAGPVDRGESTDLLKDVAKYVREQIIPKAPGPELSMIALAGGKWVDE